MGGSEVGEGVGEERGCRGWRRCGGVGAITRYYFYPGQARDLNWLTGNQDEYDQSQENG